jgi:SAM-dependent methyltransferase
VYHGFEPPNASGNVVRRTGEYAEQAESDVLNDPRMDVVPPAILKGATILDIGCGAGYLSIQLAEKHGAASVIGVDVDASLIAKARTMLEWRKDVWRGRLTERDATGSRPRGSSSSAAPTFVPLSMRVTQRWRQSAPPPPSSAAARTAASDADEANSVLERLNNVRFLCSNILLHPAEGLLKDEDGTLTSERGSRGKKPRREEHATSSSSATAPADASASSIFDTATPSWTPPLASFDVVVCFNVTKYIHLNAGDEGLMRLFRIAHSYLKPGGRLLLVAQRWASYKKHQHLCAPFAAQMSKIEINPDRRDELLRLLLAGERGDNGRDGDDKTVGFKQIEAVVTATKPFAGRKLRNKKGSMTTTGAPASSSSASSSSAAEVSAASTLPAASRTCELLILRR